MNQEKIGRFIAECRKKNNMTQSQLAEKLNITDRAISKWENGKSMPDSSIMLDLCSELKISVNELLSGEMIGMNNYDNLFLRINYRGDVARVYADGRLVADNFWNGKEMWVRMADLVGKKVELKILPLRKDAPVYFQKEQKAMIEATKGDYMLGLDSVEVIERHTLEFNDAF